MASQSPSNDDGCFKPHCFPEFEGADAPEESSRSGWSDSETPPNSGAFIPANHHQEGAEGSEPSTAQQMTMARQEGYAAGMEAGQKAAAESLAPVIQALQSAVAAMASTEAQLTGQAEKAVVELSLAIARKVIPHAIGELPQALPSVLNQALAKVMDTNRLNIRVNPDDLARLKDSQNLLDLPTIDPARLTWSADPGIGRGGCIVETDFGDIDARIEHQLMLIENLFRQQLGKTIETDEGQGTDG
ncbi:MAG: FliH/SctL family protein [Desulfosarcinaceae bacterium]|nr:FliH/SctL family protein [Desulfosarcinaceae bacterium]